MKLNNLYCVKVDCEHYRELYIHVLEKTKKDEYLVRIAVSSQKPELFINGIGLEYVKTSFFWYEQRFLPTGGANVFKEQIKERSKIKYYPNKYGMLFTYLIRIKVNKLLTNKLVCLGETDLATPFGEYIPWSQYNIPSIYFPNEMEEEILKRYRLYNLEEDKSFNIEYANECRKKEKEVIEAMDNYLESLNEK